MSAQPYAGLLPCPFCGSEAELYEGHRDHWKVRCTKCEAMKGRWFAREGAQAKAIASWNSRPEAAEAISSLLKALEPLADSVLPDPDTIGGWRCGINIPAGAAQRAYVLLYGPNPHQKQCVHCDAAAHDHGPGLLCGDGGGSRFDAALNSDASTQTVGGENA